MASSSGNTTNAAPTNASPPDTAPPADEVAPADNLEGPRRITVRVIRIDNHNALEFTLNRHTPMAAIFREVCHSWAVRRHMIRLAFDGARIKNDDTPKSLGIVDGDSIDFFWQMSGGKLDKSTQSKPSGQVVSEPQQLQQEGPQTPPDKETTAESQEICATQGTESPPPSPVIESRKVAVRNHVSGKELYLKVPLMAPMAKVMDIVCQTWGIKCDRARFFFDGIRIDPAETATSMNLDDCDTIDLFYVQTGGGVEPPIRELSTAEDDGSHSNRGSEAPPPAQPSGRNVHVFVRCDHLSKELHFKLRYATQMCEMIDTALARWNFSPTIFQVYTSERQVFPWDTPGSLGLRDGDIIHLGMDMVGS